MDVSRSLGKKKDDMATAKYQNNVDSIVPSRVPLPKKEPEVIEYVRNVMHLKERYELFNSHIVARCNKVAKPIIKRAELNVEHGKELLKNLKSDIGTVTKRMYRHPEYIDNPDYLTKRKEWTVSARIGFWSLIGFTGLFSANGINTLANKLLDNGHFLMFPAGAYLSGLGVPALSVFLDLSANRYPFLKPFIWFGGLSSGFAWVYFVTYGLDDLSVLTDYYGSSSSNDAFYMQWTTILAILSEVMIVGFFIGIIKNMATSRTSNPAKLKNEEYAIHESQLEVLHSYQHQINEKIQEWQGLLDFTENDLEETLSDYRGYFLKQQAKHDAERQVLQNFVDGDEPPSCPAPTA